MIPSRDLSKTSLRLPPRLWAEVRMRAVIEGRDAQEFVAEALEFYLASIAETGKATWEELNEVARRRGHRFQGWKRGRGGRLNPVFVPIEEEKKGGRS